MSDFYFPAFDDFALDDRECALAEFLLRLDSVRDKCNEEFHGTLNALHELEPVHKAIAEEFKAMAAAEGNSGLPFIYTFGKAELRSEALLLTAEASAGSFILILDDIVGRLRRAVVDPKTHEPYPNQFALGRLPCAGGYATTLIHAAANAYRHSKDWIGLVDDNGVADSRHAAYRASKRTLDILASTVGLQAIFRGRVCVDSLLLLSQENSRPPFETAWSTVTEIGEDFAAKYCAASDAAERVQEALESQEAVNSVGISYSGNSDLFELAPE